MLYSQPAMSDLHKKAAQLIVPRLDGNRLLEEDYFKQISALVDAGIGGFILFGGKIPDTLDSIRRLHDRAKIPLLITSDIERGLGQQIAGGTRFPNQWAVAEAIDRNNPGDIVLLHDMLTAVSEECVAAGIHAVFSPVADVNVNPDNPIICTRSFGEEPEKVSWFVKEYVKGLQNLTGDSPDSTTSLRSVRKSGTVPLLACAKHFPGHGDTAVDSHTSLPVINADINRLERVELPPFKTAIEAGVAMIMIGHLKVPALEPEPIPATFSKKIVTNLLKEQMGFNGLVVTDALDMGALKAICDEGEGGGRCLEAGCDILLHPSEPLKMLDAIVRAVEVGRVSYERVDEAYRRVMEAKSRIIAECGMRNAELNSELRTPNSELASRIALKAIKIRKGAGVCATENIVCLVIDDDGDGSVARPFLDAMRGKVPGLRVVSSPLEIKGGETALLPIFSRVSAWKGSSGLSEKSAEKLRNAISRAGRAVLISFGSPYILNSFDADVMINAFDPADFVQSAMVERLIQC
ncbi:MAG: hypothetical protein HY786_00290 [Deltaproteobacteria bacterium]|nr:hypothetical protein [Deltaproteobacteria bacterium]